MAENAKREGVISLESGLQYEILNEGNGQIPTINDKITAHYHGTLIDGTVFDSSVDRGEPASFPVNGVIAGWTEAFKSCQLDLNGNYMFLLILLMAKEELDKLLAPILR